MSSCLGDITKMDVASVPVRTMNSDSDTDSEVYETAEEYSDSNESFYSFDDVIDSDHAICSDYLDAKVNGDKNRGTDDRKTEFDGLISFVSQTDNEKSVIECVHTKNNNVKNFYIDHVDLADQVSTVTQATEQETSNRDVENDIKDLNTVDELSIETNNNVTALYKQGKTKTGLTDSDNSIEVQQLEDSTSKTVVREHFKELKVSESANIISKIDVPTNEGAKTVIDNKIETQSSEESRTDGRNINDDGIDTELSYLETNDIDIKELSFKEKLAYFEKIGFDTPKSSSKKSKRTDEVGNTVIGASDKKLGGHDFDSSDENDSLAANETSYEDLLESLLESSQVENDNKRESSDIEEFEKSDTELSDQHFKGVTGLDNLIEHNKGTETVQVNDILHKASEDVTKSDSVQIFRTEDVEINECTTENNKSDPIVQVVELGVTHLNDLPHQNNLFCAKVVYDRTENTDLETQTNERSSIAYDSSQNKTFLLPGKSGDPDENVSDHLINRQSSVIRENRLTRMPFASRSDSKILNDVGNTQDNSTSSSKLIEDSDNVLVRHVELGTASLLEGSHFKNLRHAKLVNPFISLRKTGLLERMTSGETNSIPSKGDRVLNIKNRSKPVIDVLGVAKQESIIVPEVCISVAASESNSLQTSKSSDHGVKSPDDGDESKTKLTKSMRRKIGRHNAIVSDYVTNIEKAESLRNSLNVEDSSRAMSGEEDNLNLAEGDNVIRDRSGSFVKNKRQNEVVRTVEIGTACLYEIPHLKYLHCAKIVSPSS